MSLSKTNRVLLHNLLSQLSPEELMAEFEAAQNNQKSDLNRGLEISQDIVDDEQTEFLEAVITGQEDKTLLWTHEKSTENRIESDEALIDTPMLQIIGKGGMAEVWRVEDRNLNRTLAMKILKSDSYECTSH